MLLSILGCGEPSAEVPTLVEPPLVPRNVDLTTPDIQLQPFAVRMSKLAHVLQVPVDDPMFDTLYQQRFALGDHDYARALRPDRRWSSRKIGIWVKGLLPVCNAPAFAQRYPSVASSPEDLMVRAYGRPADASDRMAMRDVLDAAGVTADDDATVCLAVLSSLEFVAQ